MKSTHAIYATKPIAELITERDKTESGEDGFRLTVKTLGRTVSRVFTPERLADFLGSIPDGIELVDESEEISKSPKSKTDQAFADMLQFFSSLWVGLGHSATEEVKGAGYTRQSYKSICERIGFQADEDWGEITHIFYFKNRTDVTPWKAIPLERRQVVQQGNTAIFQAGLMEELNINPHRFRTQDA